MARKPVTSGDDFVLSLFKKGPNGRLVSKSKDLRSPEAIALGAVEAQRAKAERQTIPGQMAYRSRVDSAAKAAVEGNPTGLEVAALDPRLSLIPNVGVLGLSALRGRTPQLFKAAEVAKQNAPDPSTPAGRLMDFRGGGPVAESAASGINALGSFVTGGAAGDRFVYSDVNDYAPDYADVGNIIPGFAGALGTVGAAAPIIGSSRLAQVPASVAKYGVRPEFLRALGIGGALGGASSAVQEAATGKPISPTNVLTGAASGAVGGTYGSPELYGAKKFGTAVAAATAASIPTDILTAATETIRRDPELAGMVARISDGEQLTGGEYARLAQAGVMNALPALIGNVAGASVDVSQARMRQGVANEAVRQSSPYVRERVANAGIVDDPGPGGMTARQKQQMTDQSLVGSGRGWERQRYGDPLDLPSEARNGLQYEVNRAQTDFDTASRAYTENPSPQNWQAMFLREGRLSAAKDALTKYEESGWQDISAPEETPPAAPAQAADPYAPPPTAVPPPAPVPPSAGSVQPDFFSNPIPSEQGGDPFRKWTINPETGGDLNGKVGEEGRQEGREGLLTDPARVDNPVPVAEPDSAPDWTTVPTEELANNVAVLDQQIRGGLVDAADMPAAKAELNDQRAELARREAPPEEAPVPPSAPVEAVVTEEPAVPVVPTPAEPVELVAPSKKLPPGLSKAAPRYNYGTKQFELRFKSDADRALYIISNANPSKSDQYFLAYLREVFPGESNEQLIERGNAVREAIKAQAALRPNGGKLDVKVIHGVPKAAKAKPTYVRRTEDNPFNPAMPQAELWAKGHATLVEMAKGMGIKANGNRMELADRIAVAQIENDRRNREIGRGLEASAKAMNAPQQASATAPGTAKIPATFGVPGKVLIGKEKLGVRYVAVDQSNVKVSHDHVTFEKNPAYEHENNRDRTSAENRQTIIENQAEWDPEKRMLPSSTPDTDVPILDKNGNVMSGNGREMTKRRWIDADPANRLPIYLAARDAKAREVGLDPTGWGPEVDVFKMLDEDVAVGSPRAAALIERSNQSQSAAMSVDEISNSLQKNMPDDIVDRLDIKDEDTLDTLVSRAGYDFFNLMFTKKFLPNTLRNTYIDPVTKSMTVSGKEVLKEALIARVLNDRILAKEVPEDLKTTLSKMLGAVMKIRSAVNTGRLAPGNDLLPLMADAVRYVMSASIGRNAAKLGQGSLFAADPNVKAVGDLIIAAQSNKSAATSALRAMSDRLLASAKDNADQLDLGGDHEAVRVYDEAKLATERIVYQAAGKPTWQVPLADFMRLDLKNTQAAGNDNAARFFHKSEVVNAFKKGEKIDPRVMADYPDLADQGSNIAQESRRATGDILTDKGDTSANIARAALDAVDGPVDDGSDFFGGEKVTELGAPRNPGGSPSARVGSGPPATPHSRISFSPNDKPPTGPLQSTADTIIALEKAFNTKFIQGDKFEDENQAGVYHTTTGSASSREWNELGVLAHEVAGHMLDDQVQLGNYGTAKNAAALDAELIPHFSVYGSSTSSKNVMRMEGVAEWMRAFVINPDEARAAAPNMAARYDKLVPTAKKKAIANFSDAVRAQGAGTPEQVWGAQLHTAHDPVEPTIAVLARVAKNPWEAIKQAWVNLGTGLWNDKKAGKVLVDKALVARGIKTDDLLPTKNYYMLNAIRAGMPDMIEDALVNGLFNKDFTARRTKGGMAEILSLLAVPGNRKATEENVKQFQGFISASAVIERIDRIRGKLAPKLANIDAKIAAVQQRITDLNFALKNTNLLTPAEVKRAQVELAKQAGALGGLHKYRNWAVDVVERSIANYTSAGAGLKQSESVTRQTAANIKAALGQRVLDSAKLYKAYADSLVDASVDSGLISTAEATAIKGSHNIYAALNRVGQKADSKIFTEAKGSTRPIEDVMVNLHRHLEAVMKMGARNQALLAYTDLIAPDRGMYEDTPGPSTSFLGHKVSPGTEGATKVKRDGKVEHWVFPEEIKTLFDPAKVQTTPPGMWQWVATLVDYGASAARVMKHSITSTPPFILRSMMREPIWAYTQTGSNPLNYPRYLLAGKDNPDLQRFRAAGGSQGVYGIKGEAARDVNAYYHVQRTLIEKISKTGWSAGDIVVNPLGKAADAYRAYERNVVQRAETANRLSEWKRAYGEAKGKGYGDRDATLYAAYKAREMMDYAEMGSWVRRANQVIPFLNASIQGTRRTSKAIIKNPKLWAKRTAIAVILPEMLAYAFNAMQGEEVLEDMRARESWKQDFFYNLHVGPNLWVMIPKPFEAGLFGAAGRRALDSAVTGESQFRGFGRSVAGSLFPVDAGTMFAGALTPAFEATVGKSYFQDRFIVPQHEAELALELRKTERSTRLAQGLAALYNAPAKAVFGDNGRIDPRSVDYLGGAYFSDWYRWTGAFSDLGRKDRDKSVGDYLRTFTKMFDGTPASESGIVKRARQNVSAFGLNSSKEAQQLNAISEQFYQAETMEERERIARDMNNLAAQINDKIELMRSSLLEKAAQEREARIARASQ